MHKISGWKSSEKGFSIVEVLMSVLVMSLFVLTGSSYMVYAAAMRNVSQQHGQIIDRIHQDLEDIKTVSSRLDNDGTNFNPNAVACRDSSYANRFRTEPTRGITATATIPASPFTMNLRSTRDTAGTAAGTATGKEYQITRNLTEVGNVLRIEYIATSVENTTEVLRIDTEVVPDAALYCN